MRAKYRFGRLMVLSVHSYAAPVAEDSRVGANLLQTTLVVRNIELNERLTQDLQK